MKKLIISEWERLWKRKSTWICFLSIPVVTIASLSFYMRRNLYVSNISPEYTISQNFAVASMQEQLISFINIVVIMLAVFLFSEDFITGQVRMILIRSVSVFEVFISKIIVLLSTIFMFLFSYFFVNLIIGYIFLPKAEEVMLFFYKNPVSTSSAMLYSIKYYIFAYFTLISFAFIIIFIAISSRSVTGAIGSSIGILFFMFIYPNILPAFNVKNPLLQLRVSLSSIIYIQYQGIAASLSGIKYLNNWICMFLCGYMILFVISSWLYIKKNDYYL